MRDRALQNRAACGQVTCSTGRSAPWKWDGLGKASILPSFSYSAWVTSCRSIRKESIHTLCTGFSSSRPYRLPISKKPAGIMTSSPPFWVLIVDSSLTARGAPALWQLRGANAANMRQTVIRFFLDIISPRPP